MSEKTLRETAQMALAFIRWRQFGDCRTAGWDGPPPTAAETHAALCDALAAPDEPVMWNVTGTREMYSGEYAEADAKDSARRIGGTCQAIALYAVPQPPAPLATPMMAMTPMLLASGRTGWYISGPEFYCEIEPEPDGKYCIFFRDKSGNEGFFDPVDDQTAPVAQPLKLLTDEAAVREPAKRPENCGTGFCSCIECLFDTPSHGIQGAKS